MAHRYRLLLVASCSCLAACSDAPADERPADAARAENVIAQAAPAPDFTLPGLDGPFALAAHRGRIVVLQFWASASPPSAAGLDALQALQDDLASEGVVVASVAGDEREVEALRAWADARAAEGQPIGVPLLTDASHALARRFGDAERLPLTVVVDRAGALRARHVGAFTSDDLLDLVGPLLIEDEEGLWTLPAGLPAPSPDAVTPLAAATVPSLVAAGAVLVDVRAPEERAAAGAVEHAAALPLATLNTQDLPADFDAPLIFLGATDDDATAAAEQAQAWGYAAVYVVEGGVAAWEAAGLLLTPAPDDVPVFAERSVIG